MPEAHHRNKSRHGRRAPSRARWQLRIATAGAALVLVGTTFLWLAIDASGRSYPMQHPIAQSNGTSSSQARPEASGHSAPLNSTEALQTPAHPTNATLAALPGIGSMMAAEIPVNSTQVVIAYGDGVDMSTNTVTLFQKADGTWHASATWSGHNGKDGWAKAKHNNDLRSPVGVFAITDAGGKYQNPGTALPYYHSSQFVDYGTGFDGESLLNAFDYVIAINYNRVAGTSPLDGTHPLGDSPGFGVWLHVDHGGPTHACVSIPASGMVTLLQVLNPADHPVIVMGDRVDLSS